MNKFHKIPTGGGVLHLEIGHSAKEWGGRCG